MTVACYQCTCPYSTSVIAIDKFKLRTVAVLLFVFARRGGRLFLARGGRRIAPSGGSGFLTPFHWRCALPIELTAAATGSVLALETCELEISVLTAYCSLYLASERFF